MVVVLGKVVQNHKVLLKSVKGAFPSGKSEPVPTPTRIPTAITVRGVRRGCSTKRIFVSAKWPAKSMNIKIVPVRAKKRTTNHCRAAVLYASCPNITCYMDATKKPKLKSDLPKVKSLESLNRHKHDYQKPFIDPCSAVNKVPSFQAESLGPRYVQVQNARRMASNPCDQLVPTNEKNNLNAMRAIRMSMVTCGCGPCCGCKPPCLPYRFNYRRVCGCKYVPYCRTCVCPCCCGCGPCGCGCCGCRPCGCGCGPYCCGCGPCGCGCGRCGCGCGPRCCGCGPSCCGCGPSCCGCGPSCCGCGPRCCGCGPSCCGCGPSCCGCGPSCCGCRPRCSGCCGLPCCCGLLCGCGCCGLPCGHSPCGGKCSPCVGKCDPCISKCGPCISKCVPCVGLCCNPVPPPPYRFNYRWISGCAYRPYFRTFCCCPCGCGPCGCGCGPCGCGCGPCGCGCRPCGCGYRPCGCGCGCGPCGCGCCGPCGCSCCGPCGCGCCGVPCGCRCCGLPFCGCLPNCALGSKGSKCCLPKCALRRTASAQCLPTSTSPMCTLGCMANRWCLPNCVCCRPSGYNLPKCTCCNANGYCLPNNALGSGYCLPNLDCKTSRYYVPNHTFCRPRPREYCLPKLASVPKPDGFSRPLSPIQIVPRNDNGGFKVVFPKVNVVKIMGEILT